MHLSPGSGSYLAGLQDVDLLLVDGVSVLFQEAVTLILHLQRGQAVCQPSDEDEQLDSDCKLTYKHSFCVFYCKSKYFLVIMFRALLSHSKLDCKCERRPVIYFKIHFSRSPFKSDSLAFIILDLSK